MCCFGGNEHPYTLEFAPANHASAPSHVVKRMERQPRKRPLGNGDQAWMLVDKDAWNESSLLELSKWVRGGDAYHLALSNPKFEYWLLLHYESGNALKDARDCDTRLLRHWSTYTKSTENMSHLKTRVQDAIANARHRDTPPCEDWPRTPGSTVYRLVERLLQFES